MMHGKYIIEDVVSKNDGSFKQERIGRIVSIESLKMGHPGYFLYLDDGDCMGFLTSNVEKYEDRHLKSGHRVVFATENSIYTLKEIGNG